MNIKPANRLSNQVGDTVDQNSEREFGAPGWGRGEVRHYNAFAAILEDGSVVTWDSGGDISEPSSELDGSIDAVEIYSSHFAFAALRSDGSVISWGADGDASAVSSELNGDIDVVKIYTSLYSFAALRSDGSVVTWGRSGSDSWDTSDVSLELNGDVDVVSIASTWHSFAAMRSDGSVVTWGVDSHGGDSSAVSSELNDDVVNIYATWSSFAALRSDGSVVTWGHSNGGGDSGSVSSALNGAIDVVNIYAASGAFAALRSDGSVVTWGSDSGGGDSDIVSSALNGTIDVVDMASTESAFAALRSDGSVVTWGRTGGDSSAVSSALNGAIDVVKIYASYHAFAALRSDGSVVTWGADFSGGDSRSVSSALNGTVDVVDIFSTGYAFAALRSDGSVVTWGDDFSGGDSGVVVSSVLNGAIDVVDIYTTRFEFSALRSDGSVFTWGRDSQGNFSSSELNNVVAFADPYTSRSSAPVSVEGTGNLSITQTNGAAVEWEVLANGTRTADGAFLIGHQDGQSQLRVTADAVQLSDDSISFSGATVYDHISGHLDGYLFKGDFTLDLNTLISTAFNDALAGQNDPHDYAWADLIEFDLNSMNIDPTKVEFGASYSLLDTSWRSQDSAVRIDLTQNGIDFGFQEVSASWYENNPLKFNVGSNGEISFSDLSINYDTVTDRLAFEGRGEFEKEFLGSNRIFTADFASDDHAVSYDPVNGWGMIGDVSYQKENVGSTLGKWGVDELTFSIDTFSDALTANGVGSLPWFETEITLGADGYWAPLVLNSINFGLDGLNKHLFYGVFVQGGDLAVTDLTERSDSLTKYSGNIDATYGPKDKAILTGSISGDYSSSEINAELDLVSTVSALVGEETANDIQNNLSVDNKLVNGLNKWFGVEVSDILNYEFLSFDADLNWDSTQQASSFNAYTSILSGVLTGDVDFKLDTSYNFNFSTELALNLPNVQSLGVLAGKTFASSNAYVEYTNDDDFSNDYVAVWNLVDLWGDRFDTAVGFKFSFDGDFELINSLKEIPIIASWDLTQNMEWAMMTANWENASSNASLVVILPDGTRLSEAEVAARDDMQIVDALSSSFSRSVIVDSPETGRWDIEVESVDGLGEVTYEASEGDVLPAVDVSSVSYNEQTQMAAIGFTATAPVDGATVRLFADTDQTGANGVEITSQPINIADGGQTFNWDYSAFEGGEFYIYALLEVPGKPITIDYSDTKVITYENYVESVAVGTGVVTEGADANQLTFQVSLNEAAPNGGQVVTLSFVNNTATFGVDTANQVSLDVGDGFVSSGAVFNTVNGVSTAQIAVPEGVVSFTVGLEVVDDAVTESTELFNFSAYTTHNVSPSTVSATIVDNDNADSSSEPSDDGQPKFTAIVDGKQVSVSPEVYTGAVDFLEYQFLGDTAGNVVFGGDTNDFINLLGGDDAANGGAGNDVLDGGTGSNFLTGGGGDDILFLDGRGGSVTWSTVTDFDGDQVNIWGWNDGVSNLLLVQEEAGAEGYLGATYHYDLNNDSSIDTSLTFTGFTQGQVPEATAQIVADNGYLLFS